MEATYTTELIEKLTAGPVVTLDCDGTLEDPWACCGKRDRMGGSPTCRHLRTDTVERIARLRAVFPDLVLVVLSWRGGLEDVTRTWLANVGIDVAAVFVPGSADTRAIGATGSGQVGFKVGIVQALARQGVEVLTGFDDNVAVVDALRAAGVPALLAPRMVEVQPWEWVAGYLGAPEKLGSLPAGTAPADLYNTKAGQLTAGPA